MVPLTVTLTLSLTIVISVPPISGARRRSKPVASERGRDRGDRGRRRGRPLAGRRLPPPWPPPVRKGSRPGAGPPARLRRRQFAAHDRRYRHSRGARLHTFHRRQRTSRPPPQAQNRPVAGSSPRSPSDERPPRAEYGSPSA